MQKPSETNWQINGFKGCLNKLWKIQPKLHRLPQQCGIVYMYNMWLRHKRNGIASRTDLPSPTQVSLFFKARDFKACLRQRAGGARLCLATIPMYMHSQRIVLKAMQLAGWKTIVRSKTRMFEGYFIYTLALPLNNLPRCSYEDVMRWRNR